MIWHMSFWILPTTANVEAYQRRAECSRPRFDQFAGVLKISVSIAIVGSLARMLQRLATGQCNVQRLAHITWAAVQNISIGITLKK